jgi:hypothetical protein
VAETIVKRLLCSGFRSDGTSVSVLGEHTSRNKCFFSMLEITYIAFNIQL